MMPPRIILPVALLISWGLQAQDLPTPAEGCGFESLTSHPQLLEFLNTLESRSELVHTRIIGKSVEGRDIPALFFSKGDFGADDRKVKVLIFAQQHGNEQSGKEGALMLASRLVRPENDKLFDCLDLALVPQVNPDGAEADRRRNAAGADLNRDHLVQTQPETMALHSLFDQYLFEVTMDVHEYYPYSESWIKYGYVKNSEVTVGTLTNVNISGEIRDYEIGKILPFMLEYIHDRGFSSFEYLPGGPPGEALIRRSTFDINDGRQSLGSQHTFSFIQEGRNGRDSLDNMQRRATGQMTGMLGLLHFVCTHDNEVKKMVGLERTRLMMKGAGASIAVQMAHMATGESLELPVMSVSTNTDTAVAVDDYRPQVQVLESVLEPEGYLLPAQHTELSSWAARQALETIPYRWKEGDILEGYVIHRIDSIDFEGDTIPCPVVEAMIYERTPGDDEYIFIPVSQLKRNLITQALEPRSMLGLATYPLFADMVKEGEAYPVLRVVRRGKQD